MDEVIRYWFESGALNQTILAVIALGGMWFLFIKWWPEHIERSKRRDANDKEIRLKEIDSEKEVKILEVQGQIEVYRDAVAHMDKMKISIEGLQSMFNDFLQNILSQFMEDRRDLIDSQIFKNKDKQ